MKGYPVNATALSDSNVLRINAEVFTSILHASPKTCIKVMACLSLRLHKLMNEIDRLSLHNATYRLVSYLLEDVPIDAQEYIEINLVVPKHVVASRISVTPETLSRTLKKLCKDGLLEVHDRHIVLLNPAKLRRLVAIGV
jgi:CRP-like cAMP-binding protein